MAAATMWQCSAGELLFSDNFDQEGLDTSKWRVDSIGFESGVGDITPTVAGGILSFYGANTAGWWGGAGIATVPTFSASDETNLVFTVDRVVDYSVGTASRTAVWITDATRQNYVFFADIRGEGNWHYNRKIGKNGDNPTGSGTAINALNVSPYTDGGQHQMKVIANGRTVKLYVDEVFGAEVDFPFSSGIVFEVGGYARAAVTDSADCQFDNVSLSTAETVSFSTNTTKVKLGSTSSTVKVKIPVGLNASQAVTVRVVSSNPSVAVPVGATGDTLTMTFAAGASNSKDLAIQGLANGEATFSLQNDLGVLVGSDLKVTVPLSAGLQMEDAFAGTSYDTTKWELSNQGFETGTGDMTVKTENGQLVMEGGLAEQYWGGISLKTVKEYMASKELRLVCTIDRVNMTQTGTSGRSGAYITTADRSQFVSVMHNYPEVGWVANYNPGAPTGGTVPIPAFNTSMNNTDQHQIKFIADGSTVQVYLDGVYGGSYAFAVSTGIHFEIGTYARAMGDTVKGVYDNVKIETIYSPITVDPAAVVIATNEFNSTVSVVVPSLLTETTPTTVTVTSRDPSVAIPEGAVNGSLTLTYPAGTATNTFKVQPVGVGLTTFDITNAAGVEVANGVSVSVVEPVYALVQDDFSGAQVDSAKWRVDNAGLEVSGLTTNSSISISNGMARLYVVSAGLGDGADVWWGGTALATKQTFSARPTAPVSFEVDRVAHVGTGAARRSAVLITDPTRSKWVMFSENDNEGGWQYNVSGGDVRSANNIAAFDDAKYNDHGNHHIKLLANGTTVKIYLDGVFGAEVPFVNSDNIVFEIGAYARTNPDSLVATYDNVVVKGPVPSITVGPASVALTAGAANPEITVTVPPQLHQTNAIQVVVTSANPAVAIPQGAVNGSLTLTFAAGAADVQKVPVVRVAKGTTTLNFACAQGTITPNTVSVLSYAEPIALFSDDFTGAPAAGQWATNAFGFEAQYASAAETSVTAVSDMIELSLTVTTNYWPGVKVTTATNFQATATDPLVFEVDRVSHVSGEVNTGTRSGVYIYDSTGTNFVLFADLTENGTGWCYNRGIGQAGDNATGGGANIPAFDDAAFNDGGLHRIKIVANGSTVALYVDGVYGTEVAFPFSQGIQFAVCVLGRAEGDSIVADFDNVAISGSRISLEPAKLNIARQADGLAITWTGTGTLQEAASVLGTWTDVNGASSPYTVTKANATGTKFYRVIQH